MVQHGVFPFVLRRLALGILTLFLVSLLVFGATQALPGDPAQAILGNSVTPERLAELRRQLHLNESVPSQYIHWIRGLITGDPGDSLANGLPVTEVLHDRIVNSGFLVVLSALVAIPLAILLGVRAALRRDSLFDAVSGLLLLVLAALPEFVVGVLLIVLFATNVFQWLPGAALLPPDAAPWNHFKELVLPAATLVLPVVPYIARVTRASMVEVLESDYVEMARLKGLPERTVVWRHALPNALPATFQVTALSLAYLTGGIVVVEFVFGYPGIGTAMRDAVANRDLPVLQAIAMLIAAVYVVTNLLADVATILVTPRLRTKLR